MAFPATLESLKNTWTWSEQRTNHATDHNSISDLLAAVQAKIWIDGSADTNSIDYYIKKSNKYSITVGFSFANYICDGTNDHIQIQQAIDYLESVGWGKLIIKEGSYSIAATITVLYDNITIIGHGAKTLLTLANGVNSHVIKVWDGVTTYKNITIRDLQINGNISNQVQQVGSKSGIHLELTEFCTVDNVIANYCLDFWVSLNLWSGCKNRVINCTTNYCWWDGIGVIYSNENIISNNGAKWNGHAWIILKWSNYCSVTGNNCNNNNTGLVVEVCNKNVIFWNTCNSNSGWSGIGLKTAEQCTISWNTCNGNGYGWIRCDGGRRNTITGNTCNANSSYPGEEWLWSGILLIKSSSPDYSTHNIVTGNTCCDWKDVPTQKYWVAETHSGNDYNVINNNYLFGNIDGWVSLMGVNSIESDNNGYSNVANFWKYKLVPSLSTDDLVLSVKNWEWNDPTPWKPILYTDGNGVIRTITAPLSVTAPAWIDHLNAGRTGLATKQVDFFPYFQWNTTTSSTNILIRRFPEATTMADIVNSGTDEKGAIGIVNYNATDTLVNIGRFSAILWVSATYLWTLWTDIKHKPTNESRWLDFGTVFTGFSAVPTSITSTYKVIWDTCFYRPHAGSNGTSNATSMTITAPFKAVDTWSAHWTWSCMAVDSGAFQANPGCLYYSAVNAYIEVYKTWAFGAWTASGAKNIKDGMITYKI